MKELSIEEKAKRYDEAIERAKCYKGHDVKCAMEYVFPELAEPEDERIRKHLITLFINDYGKNSNARFAGIKVKDIIAWLEKQGEPTDINPSEFDLRLYKLLKQFETLPKEKLASSLAFYLNLVQNDGAYKSNEKQGEQKPVISYDALREGIAHFGITQYQIDNWLKKYIDVEEQGKKKPYKVEPKFKQGDTIREKETGNLFYVNSIEDFGYTLHYIDCPTKGCTMSFKYEDDYELVEHNPADKVEPNLLTVERAKEISPFMRSGFENGYVAWSEEDEAIRTRCIGILGKCYMGELPTKVEEELNWLKSLKNRITWKPSKEQMEFLKKCIEAYNEVTFPTEVRVLSSLYNDLKKLKG